MPEAMYRTEYVDAAKYIGGHGVPAMSGIMVRDAVANTASDTTIRPSKNPYNSNHEYDHIPSKLIWTTFRIHIA